MLMETSTPTMALGQGSVARLLSSALLLGSNDYLSCTGSVRGG